MAATHLLTWGPSIIRKLDPLNIPNLEVSLPDHYTPLNLLTALVIGLMALLIAAHGD